MNKAFFRRIWRIITVPAATWSEISDESVENKPYLSTYYYPLLGLVGFAAFLSPFLHSELSFRESLGQGIMIFIRVFTAYFAAYYLSSFALFHVFVQGLNLLPDKTKAEKLSVYALTPLLLIRIFTYLVKDLFFLYIFVVYTVYLVWEAADSLYAVPNKQKGVFTALATPVLLLAPFLIEWVLKLVLPGLS